MLRSYEAIYENGQLRWLAERPNVETARVIITVLDDLAGSHDVTVDAASELRLEDLGGSEPSAEVPPRRRY